MQVLRNSVAAAWDNLGNLGLGRRSVMVEAVNHQQSGSTEATALESALETQGGNDDDHTNPKACNDASIFEEAAAREVGSIGVCRLEPEVDESEPSRSDVVATTSATDPNHKQNSTDTPTSEWVFGKDAVALSVRVPAQGEGHDSASKNEWVDDALLCQTPNQDGHTTSLPIEGERPDKLQVAPQVAHNVAWNDARSESEASWPDAVTTSVTDPHHTQHSTVVPAVLPSGTGEVALCVTGLVQDVENEAARKSMRFDDAGLNLNQIPHQDQPATVECNDQDEDIMSLAIDGDSPNNPPRFNKVTRSAAGNRAPRRVTSMAARKWMLVMERGPRNVVFYAFDSEDGARALMASSWHVRILFRWHHSEGRHEEVEARGHWNGRALRMIRWTIQRRTPEAGENMHSLQRGSVRERTAGEDDQVQCPARKRQRQS